MSFLERAIRRGVSDAVGKAIGNAVRQTVEPAATNFANQAANAVDQAAYNTQQQAVRASGLEGAMSNLERSMQGYATKAAANMKVCPNCEKAVTADKKFCPDCGSPLPEKTVAEDAVCPGCGTQNNIGTKFCAACGTKLPAAIREEQNQQRRLEAALAQWDQLLPQYPKWCCGGTELNIEQYEQGNVVLYVTFNNNPYAARQAVEQYRQVLMQNGFRQAGQYPTIEQLYKRINGVVCNVDTEHCFEGDPDTACIGFCVREPYGGFDYVKPEPRQKTSLKNLFGF